MLCMAWVMTALGEAPEISRNRPDTTSPFLHFLKVQCMASMRKSVVDLPGCPPKWLAGGRLWVSDKWTRSSDMMDDRIFVIVLRSVGDMLWLGSNQVCQPCVRQP